MEVWTEAELVTEARRKAFLDLVRMAPDAKVIRDFAAECGIDLGPPPDECIRCTLCLRVCREVVGPAALRMVKVNGRKLVVPIPQSLYRLRHLCQHLPDACDSYARPGGNQDRFHPR